MASLSCTFLVLIAAFVLINGEPSPKVTTKTTKVTHTAVHLHPPVHTSTTHTQTHTQFPYIYGATGPSQHVAVSTHQLPPYPYMYGLGPSTSYPYVYGLSAPFSNYLPNYGLPYGYPSGYPSGLFGGYYGGFF